MKIRIDNIECRFSQGRYEIIKWYSNKYYGAEEQMIADGKIPMFSQKGWVGVANDIAERMDYFFDPKNNNKLKY